MLLNYQILAFQLKTIDIYKHFGTNKRRIFLEDILQLLDDLWFEVDSVIQALLHVVPVDLQVQVAVVVVSQRICKTSEVCRENYNKHCQIKIVRQVAIGLQVRQISTLWIIKMC